MTESTLPTTDIRDYSQLTQARVPLAEAGDAFAMRDASGKIPIILVPTQRNRVRNELVLTAVLIIVGGITLGFLVQQSALISLAVLVGLLMLILGVYRAFFVRIPEGSKALLTRGGQYVRTIGAGTHLLSPWYIVSHLVTEREIPFDVPVVNSPTKDNVRVNVDTLFTFRITDPYQFVYHISATDFDQVFQAVCQDTLRSFVRTVTSDQVMDLKRIDLGDILISLNEDFVPYGVEVMKTTVTFAQPPAEFMQSQEARQMAILQQKEQQERQALAIRRQRDHDELAHQQVLGQVERDKEALQIAFQKAEAHHRLVELEAATEALRMTRMEERFEQFPKATAWQMELAHLEVARALAGNARAILQVGQASDISQALLVRDILHQQSAENGASEPTPDIV
jgi:regulator of protease activity HflC (stomatin/prohibitin superfamily)